MTRTGWCVTLACMALLGCGGGGADDDGYAERMATEHATDRPVPSGAAAGGSDLPLEERDVVYAEVDGESVTGFLARPADAPADVPGIIVIQEWWGLNDNIRDMTRKLARLGYTALAVDLYRGRVATTPDEARALMGEAGERDAQLVDNLRQARAWLAEQGATRVGVIGWCFGGGWSLRTALEMPGQIDATVIYYGRLVDDPARLAALDSPILGIFGADDRGIPVESVHAFEGALAELGKPATIEIYQGAEHAFANPSGTRYDAAAAEDAWAKTRAFLAEHLGG